jgi:Ribbon-helix-helix protein, copG family
LKGNASKNSLKEALLGGRPISAQVNLERIDVEKITPQSISNLASSYYNRNMKAISIKLPDPLFYDLAERAKTSASSQSEVIRSALSAYLHGDVRPSTASADLSTNTKHLKGFGE